MSSIMDKWFGFDPPKVKLPPVPPPEPVSERQTPEDVAKRMRRTKGRSETILTGDLVPKDVGKRTLLG